MEITTSNLITYVFIYFCVTHLRQERHNSKFGIFELLVQKEAFTDALLTGIVSQHSLQNSLLENCYVVVAIIVNYITSEPLKVCPEKITHFEL